MNRGESGRGLASVALMQLVHSIRVAMLIATRNMELAGKMDRVTLREGQVVELD
jgi:lipoprotein-releasing system ATP-binding protein